MVVWNRWGLKKGRTVVAQQVYKYETDGLIPYGKPKWVESRNGLTGPKVSFTPLSLPTPNSKNPLLWHKVLSTDFVSSLFYGTKCCPPTSSRTCKPTAAHFSKNSPANDGGEWEFSIRYRRLRRLECGGPFPAASLCRRHSGPRWGRRSGSRKCGGEPESLPHSQPCNGLLPLQGRSG